MRLPQLRKNFHSLIDKVNDSEMLKMYYDALAYSASDDEASTNSLSASEKKQVLISFEESKNRKNLMSNDSVIKRFKKWSAK